MTNENRPKILSSSRLRDARACQRLHRFKYLDGYRPVADADVLRFGSLVHAGLEAWWKAPADRIDAALAAMRVGEADPFERGRAEAMVVGYDARWGDEAIEVLAVEVEFCTSLVNPETQARSRTWLLGGKIDAIVRIDGRVLLVEHKTTSEDVTPGSSYWKRLRLDGQVSIYYEGARSLGFDVEGCVYDVLVKPGLRPYKVNQKRKADETPDEFRARCMETIGAAPSEYYARGEVVRLETEMADALTDIWQIGRMLRENELGDRFPRNVDSCVRYGRPCPFFSVCAGEASLDDPTLYRKSMNVHPELAEVASL
jgi:hypothetical protein